MDWSWLKVIIEKLRIHSVVGSGVFVTLCAILFTKDYWALALAGLLSFLIIEFVIYLFGFLKKKRIVREIKMNERQKYEEEQRQYTDLIWLLFLGLSERNLKLALATFGAPRDPTDKYVRIVKMDSLLYSQLLSSQYSGYGNSDPFTISINNSRSMIVCLQKKHIGDSMVVYFDSYFYNLIEEFLKTGVKKKI
ncbi:hypothetical protein [Bacteroides graminisolvens]|uniref:hypothetical protein n=1 Tax=Bacteroides graminisolvens TaxID=477666 RepID=UPI0029C8C15F|nr:hypothetical protein [Bacteroides graminisolvens]